MERIPLISFVGPEGSGKSTQARLLAKQLGLPFVSTGDMIRVAIANDQTDLGDACRKMSERGNYLEGPILLQLVAKRLQEPDVDKGVILDGGFRTVEETVEFQKVLTEAGRDFDIKVFFLRVPVWESTLRLVANNRGRKDDTLEKILPRLGAFYEDLGKRMSFVHENWDFVMILANGRSVDEVNNKVREQISTRGFALPFLQK